MISITKCYYSAASPACLASSSNVEKDSASNKHKYSALKGGIKSLGRRYAQPKKTKRAPSV